MNKFAFHKILLLIAVFLSYSCASMSKEGPWIERTIKLEKMVWHWCSANLDPWPETWDKGWCFVGEEYRIIDHHWPRKDEEETRQKKHFCSFDDLPCMQSNRFQQMKLRYQ